MRWARWSAACGSAWAGPRRCWARAAGYQTGAGVSISRLEGGLLQPEPGALRRHRRGARPDRRGARGPGRLPGTSGRSRAGPVADPTVGEAAGSTSGGAKAPPGQKELNARRKQIEHETGERTRTITELGDAFNEAHDRARTEFFLRLVEIAGRVRGFAAARPERRSATTVPAGDGGAGGEHSASADAVPPAPPPLGAAGRWREPPPAPVPAGVSMARAAPPGAVPPVPPAAPWCWPASWRCRWGSCSRAGSPTWSSATAGSDRSSTRSSTRRRPSSPPRGRGSPRSRTSSRERRRPSTTSRPTPVTPWTGGRSSTRTGSTTWEALGDAGQRRYLDLVDVAAAQIAIVTFDYQDLLITRGGDRDHLIHLADQVLTQSREAVRAHV